MVDTLKKILEPIQELQNIRGVDLPIGLEFLQLVVTGPPGAGKSYYIEQIRGWPNEGYLDISQKGWWKNQSLVFRPREVHFGIPFVGISEPLTVFDKEYLNQTPPPGIDFARISIPPEKKHFYQTDYRGRYIFEFLIPNPTTIYERRLARQTKGYFPVDENLSLEMVRQQVSVYREIALYLHRAGLNVYIRKGLDKPPMRIAEKGIANVPRWTLTSRHTSRPSLKTLNGWKALLGRKTPTLWLTPEDKPQRVDSTVRIAHDGRSFEMRLATARLKFQPEIPIGSSKRINDKSWIIGKIDNCSATEISGFFRIQVDETIVIGSDNKEFKQLFSFTDEVKPRHVSITNRRGDLIVSPLTETAPINILRLDDQDYRERLEQGRLQSLLDIRNIYGGPIFPLARQEALRLIRSVNDLLADEPFRAKNSHGNPGGLIELDNKTTPIVVGDLHGQVDNLLKILTENCLLDSLKTNTATLILLGDAVHSEIAQELDQFDSSLLMMDLIFKLKRRFPQNLFYLRGNHDSFDPGINKNGVLQGALFQEYLIEIRGEEYAQEMQKFYDGLPYILKTEYLLTCHAGPPRMAATRENFIDIADDQLLMREMTNNRLQRLNYLAGYVKGDVKKLRKCFGLTPKTRLIVGHTPMDPFGSFWLHVGTIKNHHVIYSAHPQGPSLFIRTGENFMPISFPAEPLTDIINNLK